VQKNELAIFVDDDNYIADDYISQALKLVHKNSKWGCFGGRQVPNPDTRISSYFRDFLPYVGIRDLGELEISQLASGSWQPIEPIGAGMCLHPQVVHQFLDYIQEDSTKYFSLGRKGKGLLSGEDSFIARQASFIGMYWGYSPDLKMIHDINISRLKLLYFVRLIFNYGRSDVILDSALGVQPSHPYPDNLLDVLIRILYSGRKALLGFLMGLRALGQYVESSSPKQ
jgi:GT2 family glycosyltransferase